MADFIRREIKPLLPRVHSSVLEIIVGILEISGETGRLSPEDHGDLMDLLLTSDQCGGDARSAATLCKKLAEAANLRVSGGSSAHEAFGTTGDVEARVSEERARPAVSRLMLGTAFLAAALLIVPVLRRRR
eukprot:TRINITY_DN65846_c0_g1_i1.p1 TRINITY_DN65846_c0_g1~~TRINITY_DN65846_c0_g1_i1.p1  ORF type:complete len:131 (+),score=22.82 TRINITY_DN65846_c0_g1_i1:95-487(+)